MEADEVLDKLLGRMTELVDRSNTSLDKIERELAELKDSRFRPYFTSMGAFLVIVVGVMSYVYSLESRLNGYLLGMTSDMAVMGQSISTLDDRLSTRTGNTIARWDRHEGAHQQHHASHQVLVNRLLDSGALNAPFVDGIDEGSTDGR